MTIMPAHSAATTPRQHPLPDPAVTFADLPHGALAVLVDGVTVVDTSLADRPSTVQFHVEVLAAMQRHVARLAA